MSRHTITAALTEYPFYSIAIGEPPTHVVGMINQVLLVMTVQRWASLTSRRRLLFASLTPLSLGSMPAMNAWDRAGDRPL